MQICGTWMRLVFGGMLACGSFFTIATPGRAVAPASECDKKRYTGSLGASGVGLRLPLAAIVKVNAKVKHDMSASTTIKKIALQLGWRCELFECVIGGVTHKRWYAVDDETGAYVTSQTKAWMDTAGMLLYAKMIGPHIVAARREGVTRSVLVMDHHPSHDHPLVRPRSRHRASF